MTSNGENRRREQRDALQPLPQRQAADVSGGNVLSAPFRNTDREGGRYIPQVMAFTSGLTAAGFESLGGDDASHRRRPVTWQPRRARVSARGSTTLECGDGTGDRHMEHTDMVLVDSEDTTRDALSRPHRSGPFGMRASEVASKRWSSWRRTDSKWRG
jgi:hypothetical protein